jgi:hypothetical protein
VTVRDIDKGWERIKASLSEFAKHDVIVGWIEGQKENRSNEQSGENSASTINNATLAAIHEFGTSDGRIPEGRLGFREWQDRNQGRIDSMIAKAYTNTVDGSKPMRELNKLGLWAVSDWRNYQRTVQPGPPISQARIDQIRKAHGKKAGDGHKKLVDTGQLVNGATHQVRRRVGG